MTFAEYNTDANFDNNESTLEELVRIGKSEGMTKDAIKAALSPKWQQSTKLSKFDDYYGEDIPAPTPFKEDAQIKAKATQNAINDVVKKQQSNIKGSDKDFINYNNSLADNVQKEEAQKAAENSKEHFDEINKIIDQSREGYKKIDDKMIANIPTFIWDRYKNGEFGKPGTSEAKNRLAYFVLNGFQNSLKVLSNGLMQMGGRSPMFADTTSDWEKFQSTNMAKGMENRWRKYEAETQGAIDLLKKQGTEEQDIMNGIAKIATNNKLQTVFNMMTENQKAHAIDVIIDIGDKIKNLKDDEVTNFLMGAFLSDKNFDGNDLLTAMGIKLGTDVLKSDEAQGIIEKVKTLVNNANSETDSKDTPTIQTAGVTIPGLKLGNGKEEDTKIPTPEEMTEGTIFEKKSYEGEGSKKKTSTFDLNIDDKTVEKYKNLITTKPEGIKTDLINVNTLDKFIADNPKMKVKDILKKSGVNDSILNTAKEVKKAAEQAEKDYKNTKDLEAFKARMNELGDYMNNLNEVCRRFGYADFLRDFDISRKVKRANNTKK